MNYCINQPLEKYGTEIQGMTAGPYPVYRDRPALLSLIFLTTSIPYLWEINSPVAIVDRPSNIKPHHEGMLADTLLHKIGDKLVAHWLTDLNPWQFHEFIQGFDLTYAPLCRSFTPAQVLYTIKARAAAWVLGPYGHGVRLKMDAKVVNELSTLDKKVRKEVFRGYQSEVSVH